MTVGGMVDAHYLDKEGYQGAVMGPRFSNPNIASCSSTNFLSAFQYLAPIQILLVRFRFASLRRNNFVSQIELR